MIQVGHSEGSLSSIAAERHRWNPLSVLWQRQTYLSLLYLVSAFPLGYLYFVVLVVGLSASIATAIVIVGLLFLPVMFLIWWGFASFERQLAMWWLDVDIAPMAPPLRGPITLWQRLVAFLRNPVTWKSLVYLLLELPFGIITFLLTLFLLSASLGALFYPVSYVVNSLNYQTSSDQGSVGMFYGLIPLSRGVEPAPLLLSLVIALLGVAAFIGSLHALRGLAWLWGRFARLMLGMSDTQMRLAEARAATTYERARAEQADQSRRELIVNVSHELRTPIASIRAHVDVLLLPEDERPADTNTQQYLTIVQREAERLGALVDDLLALARADANELRLDVRPIACGEVTEEVYQSLAPLARRERQVTLVHRVATNLPLVMADRDRLAQVLLNLVRNAITYTPAGGIVSIDVAQADQGSVAISVADTGIGIPPEDLARVFDRFYRTDSSRARSSGGFGLGLSIARDLMEAMGGQITAESNSGEGSVFRVYLRIAPQLALPQANQG
jgi:two-component system, OmpR family, phosphate regulon sensor histidine kinase PhoR